MDARLPDRWLHDRRWLGLTDEAWRLATTALLWSVANRTGGRITIEDLDLMPVTGPVRQAAGELEDADLWHAEAGHWLIGDYDDTQTSAAELDRRAHQATRERLKKQRQRARKRAALGGDSRAGARATPGDTGGDRPPRSRARAAALSPGDNPGTVTGSGSGSGSGITEENRSTYLGAPHVNGHARTGPANVAESRRLAVCIGCDRPVIARRAGQLRARGLPMRCPRCADAANRA